MKIQIIEKVEGGWVNFSKHAILTVVTTAVIRICKLPNHLGVTSRLTNQRLVIMEIAITSYLV